MRAIAYIEPAFIVPAPEPGKFLRVNFSNYFGYKQRVVTAHRRGKTVRDKQRRNNHANTRIHT